MMRTLILSVFAFLAISSLRAQNAAETRSRALAGDGEAMLELSEMYRFGLNVMRNADSADYWVSQALQTGHPEALFLEGTRLTGRLYSRTDFGKGIKYLKQAADSGNVAASSLLADIYAQRDPDTESARYYSLATSFEYRKTAAEGGDTESMIGLAECYLGGKGTARNDSLGRVWLETTVQKRRNLNAALRLGDLWLEGRFGKRPEPFLAAKYYRSVLESEKANIDQKARADIGLHEADQMIKRVHNAVIHTGGMAPAGSLFYQLRE